MSGGLRLVVCFAFFLEFFVSNFLLFLWGSEVPIIINFGNVTLTWGRGGRGSGN